MLLLLLCPPRPPSPAAAAPSVPAAPIPVARGATTAAATTAAAAAAAGGSRGKHGRKDAADPARERGRVHAAEHRHVDGQPSQQAEQVAREDANEVGEQARAVVEEVHEHKLHPHGLTRVGQRRGEGGGGLISLPQAGTQARSCAKGEEGRGGDSSSRSIGSTHMRAARQRHTEEPGRLADTKPCSVASQSGCCKRQEPRAKERSTGYHSQQLQQLCVGGAQARECRAVLCRTEADRLDRKEQDVLVTSVQWQL
eukprot:SAG22_NODE_1428_length_4445_cov_1.417663_2_plen_254_part_00